MIWSFKSKIAKAIDPSNNEHATPTLLSCEVPSYWGAIWCDKYDKNNILIITEECQQGTRVIGLIIITAQMFLSSRN